MDPFIRNTTITSSNGNGNSSKNKSSVHYRLFMHQEELRRRNTCGISIVKSKISLTESLISQNVQNLHDRSDEDLRIICREMSFKNHLKKHMSHYSQLIKLVKGIDKDLDRLSTVFVMKRENTYSN